MRRARQRCEAAQPYADKMRDVLTKLAASPDAQLPLMLVGKPLVHTTRLVVVGSDRGLCGGFNANLVKEVSLAIHDLQEHGKKVEIVCVGSKVFDMLKIKHAHLIIDTIEGIEKQADIKFAANIAKSLIQDFEGDACDEVILYYNRFVNMVTQKPTALSLMPFETGDAEETTDLESEMSFAPSEDEILERLLPHNVSTQLSMASEQAARMTAMENATKNAGEMIDKLSLQYNRSRQAAITTELTEIVAGAESLNG